jgi:hypothetical protein
VATAVQHQCFWFSPELMQLVNQLFNTRGYHLERNRSSYSPVQGIRERFLYGKKPLGVMPPGAAILVLL